MGYTPPLFEGGGCSVLYFRTGTVPHVKFANDPVCSCISAETECQPALRGPLSVRLVPGQWISSTTAAVRCRQQSNVTAANKGTEMWLENQTRRRKRKRGVHGPFRGDLKSLENSSPTAPLPSPTFYFFRNVLAALSVHVTRKPRALSVDWPPHHRCPLFNILDTALTGSTFWTYF